MSKTSAKSRSISTTLAGAGWLSVTVLLALLTLYFVGLDQGASSMFGSSNTAIHEFMHDARHLLGFPCH
ncbi:CbtB domain-containing protein [Mycobacterium sp. NPDC048908]|uniref:CbtB domain-containing protein n=1 Tax=Mycobacterium sp. NPDC048908 TaxID=3364292 RepID=UPI00371918EE